MNLVPDFVMNRLETVDEGIDWTGGRRLQDLNHTDAICMFARDIEEVVVAEASKVGLRLTLGKPKL